MSLELFHIVDENPNVAVGGGGCLCSETAVQGDGPYTVFYTAETSSNISPHAVVCAGCIESAACQLALKPGDNDLVPAAVSPASDGEENTLPKL